MKNVTSVNELKEAILLLEIKKSNEGRMLKERFHLTVESLQPVNLLKDKLNDIVTSPSLKHDIVNASLGLAVGYLSKKIAVGATHNPIKQLFGALLQVGVTSLVSKNADGITSTIMKFVNSNLKKKE